MQRCPDCPGRPELRHHCERCDWMECRQCTGYGSPSKGKWIPGGVRKPEKK
jgi:hypothetical protein